METTTAKNLYLRAYLDGRPVDCATLLAAVWEGSVTELGRVEMALDRRPYLNAERVPGPKELRGNSPVSSEFFGKEGV